MCRVSGKFDGFMLFFTQLIAYASDRNKIVILKPFFRRKLQPAVIGYAMYNVGEIPTIIHHVIILHHIISFF